jgi:tRNA(Arg) A34 adenosine deaminase TadA
MHADAMREAIRLAREAVASGRGGPFGAVIVHQGEIIGSGSNEVTSRHDPTAHAEVQAIRDACARLGTFKLEGCEIYTSCEPCPMCLSAIYWARLSRIYFACTREDAAAAGFDDEWLYQEIPRPLGERSIPTVQMLRTDGLLAMQDWESKTDRTDY